MARSYDHREVESAARAKWKKLGLYTTDVTSGEEPYYLLVEFPYPSGDLHIGHWYAFAVTDIYARIRRARGQNVLFPIGFDAFGLPAENAAIRNGLDPKEWTYRNIERMRGQLESMGASFDWSREVITCDPSYYQWTQWLFTKLFEHGLAERRAAPVKWCPKDQTVLANEQVIDGRCERCGTEVEERNLTQWFLRITQYAERLLEGLDSLPWRAEIKDAQRAWIGKSAGAYLDFAISGHGTIRVFTTRPDTVFGATYVVLAPEHPLVGELMPSLTNAQDVSSYVEATKRKTERERSENKEKTGVELKGVTAVNPATKEEIPVFVADYVLGSYGTGAVMAVPAHDERDFDFARKHDLPIKHVVMPVRIDEKNPHVPGKEVVFRTIVMAIVRNPATNRYLVLRTKKPQWTTFVIGGIEEGEDVETAARREILEESGYKNLKLIRILGGPVHSEFFASHKDVNRIAHNTTIYFELENDEAVPLDPEEAAKHEVDWVPFEELTRENLSHAELDIVLQRLATGNDVYTGDGVLVNSGPFDGASNREAMRDIVESIGGERTTNYRLRDWLVSRQRYWGCPIPVVYDPEGEPHAIPAEHLPWLLPTDVDFTPTGKSPLASSEELRTRVARIFGEGWTPEYDTLDTFVDSSWYFLRYLDPRDPDDFSDPKLMKRWLPVDRYSGGSEHTTMHVLYARFFTKALHDLALVPVDEPFEERYNRGLIMGPDGQKMSKSKGNVISPDEVVAEHGADAVRIYLAFIGPYNEPGSYPWQLDGVPSMRRFIERVIAQCDRAAGEVQTEPERRGLARTCAKITEDGDRFKLNTAVASLMTLLNDFERHSPVSKPSMRGYVQLLAPFAPHVAEHLWEQLGGTGSVHGSPWPSYPRELLADAIVTIAVQVNGKRRGEILIAPDATEEQAIEAARAIPGADEALRGGQPRIVYVPGRILNIVV